MGWLLILDKQALTQFLKFGIYSVLAFIHPIIDMNKMSRECYKKHFHSLLCLMLLNFELFRLISS